MVLCIVIQVLLWFAPDATVNIYVFLCVEGTPLSTAPGQKRSSPRTGGLCTSKKSKKDGAEDAQEGATIMPAAFHCTVSLMHACPCQRLCIT